jgi:hypothetical protein
MDFYLDGKLLVGSQVISPWLEVPAFIRVLLPVGEHELKDRDGSMTYEISCASGSLIYLYPRPEWRATGEKGLFGNIKKELIGEFVVSDTPIDSLEDRRRVLFYNHY